MPTNPTFDELIQPVTVDAHKRAMQAAGESVGSDYGALPPLDMNRTLALQVTPIAMAVRDSQINQAIKGGFKDWAEDQWLSLLAENQYGLEGGRLPETFARTVVTVTNTTAGEFTFGPREQQFKSSVTGRIAFNEGPFTLKPTGDPDGGDVVDVPVIAEFAGTDYNAAAGTLTEMIPAIDGVTVTNAVAAVASDEETDPLLRTRCDDALGPLSPDGPPNIYRDVARNTYILPDGTYVWTHKPDDYPGAINIGITRVQVVENVPDLGDVKVYLASANGVPSAPQVAAVHALFLLWARPNGVALLPTAAASLVTVNIAYSATYRTRYGVTETQLAGFVEDGLEAFFSDEDRNPLGGVIVPPATAGTLFRTELSEVISGARGSPDAPAPIVDLSSLTPGSNTTISVGQLAVLGTVTPTFTAIP